MADLSRIRVTPAEEEDIVILAGAVEDMRTAPTNDASSVQAPSSVDEASAFPGEAARRDGSRTDDTMTASAPPAQSSYEGTTLEDLQRVRMSGMQKAIIALAIVAVLAFIIWYVLLR